MSPKTHIRQPFCSGPISLLARSPCRHARLPSGSLLSASTTHVGSLPIAARGEAKDNDITVLIMVFFLGIYFIRAKPAGKGRKGCALGSERLRRAVGAGIQALTGDLQIGVGGGGKAGNGRSLGVFFRPRSRLKSLSPTICPLSALKRRRRQRPSSLQDPRTSPTSSMRFESALRPTTGFITRIRRSTCRANSYKRRSVTRTTSAASGSPGSSIRASTSAR